MHVYVCSLGRAGFRNDTEHPFRCRNEPDEEERKMIGRQEKKEKNREDREGEDDDTRREP